MSGTSLVILAMYSTVNVVTQGGALSPHTLPYLVAVLIAAAILTCIATIGQLSMPTRTTAKGATLRGIVRRTSGPGVRRR